MWELYDALIQGIPPERQADKLNCGAVDTLVQREGVSGFTHTFSWEYRPESVPHRELGMPLRELAVCIKSWDFREASIGLAALNAYYNDVATLRTLGLRIPESSHVEDRSQDPFIIRQNDIKGKNVVVIGHFPYIDQLFAPVCNLAIIEKFAPTAGDYPEQAADYLLPEADFVFIPSYAFVEKTLPRYLSLAAQAHVTIVGPATTMAPVLFDYGVSSLAGYVVKDNDALERVSLGLGGNHHGLGQKVLLEQEN
jgi:uncharacterized protein (DUF4213/DUF364 family)